MSNMAVSKICNTTSTTNRQCMIEKIPTSPNMSSARNKKRKAMSPVSPCMDIMCEIPNSFPVEQVSATMESIDDNVVAEQLMIFAQQSRSDANNARYESDIYISIPENVTQITMDDDRVSNIHRCESDELEEFKTELVKVQQMVIELQDQVKKQKEIIHTMQSQRTKSLSVTTQDTTLPYHPKLMMVLRQDRTSSSSIGQQEQVFCRMIGPPDMKLSKTDDLPYRKNSFEILVDNTDRTSLTGKTKCTNLPAPKIMSTDHSVKSWHSKCTSSSSSSDSTTDDQSVKTMRSVRHPLLHSSIRDSMMKRMNDQIKNFWESQEDTTGKSISTEKNRSSSNSHFAGKLKVVKTSVVNPTMRIPMIFNGRM